MLERLSREILRANRILLGSAPGAVRVAASKREVARALAEGAQVSLQPITYQGKTVQAQAVRIQPYLNDPMHARFEKYLRKTYTFILSEQVPGSLYQLHSSLGKPETVRTGTQPADAPVIDETLTLISVTPKQP